MCISPNTKDLQVTTVLSGALIEENTMQHNKNGEYTFFVIIKENRSLSHALWKVHKNIWFIENKQVQFIWIRMPNYNKRLNRKEGFAFCPPSQWRLVLFCVLFKLRKKGSWELTFIFSSSRRFWDMHRIMENYKNYIKIYNVLWKENDFSSSEQSQNYLFIINPYMHTPSFTYWINLSCYFSQIVSGNILYLHT